MVGLPETHRRSLPHNRIYADISPRPSASGRVAAHKSRAAELARNKGLGRAVLIALSTVGHLAPFVQGAAPHEAADPGVPLEVPSPV